MRTQGPRARLPLLLIATLGVAGLTGCGGTPAEELQGETATLSDVADDGLDLVGELGGEAGMGVLDGDPGATPGMFPTGETEPAPDQFFATAAGGNREDLGLDRADASQGESNQVVTADEIYDDSGAFRGGSVPAPPPPAPAAAPPPPPPPARAPPPPPYDPAQEYGAGGEFAGTFTPPPPPPPALGPGGVPLAHVDPDYRPPFHGVEGPSIDSMLRNPKTIMTTEQANAVLDHVTATASRSNGSIQDYAAVVRAIEVVSPESSPADVAAIMRPMHYPTHIFPDLGPMSMPSRDAVMSDELRRRIGGSEQNWIDSPLGKAVNKWGEVPRTRGGTSEVDIGHSMTAVDAYRNTSNPLLKGANARTYTFLGDYGSGAINTVKGALSKIGIGDDGDPISGWNMRDQRGNTYGSTLVTQGNLNPGMRLSDTILTTNDRPTAAAVLSSWF